MENLTSKETFYELIKYGIIGISGLAIDFGIYYILITFFQINPELANFISSSCSLTTNFFLNSYFTFKVYTNLLRRYIEYYLIGQITTLFVTICLFVFVTLLNGNKMIVKLVATMIAVIIQFFVNKMVTFRKKNVNEKTI